MKKNEYKCELCKGVFKKGWSDEEQTKEMKDNFGDLPEEERATICDDCYKNVMGYYSPWSTQ